MSLSLEDLKATLANLPTEERADLAHYLLHTLDQEEDGAAAEWLALAERRMADIRAGKAIGIPCAHIIR